MAYNYKDVFYLSATHETTNSSYGSAGVEGVVPLDVSAYVDPIARGKSKGTGLALYRVHMDASSTSQGRTINASEDGSMRVGLTVKEYTTTGDAVSSIGGDQLTSGSDLLAWGADWHGCSNASPSTTNVTVSRLPDINVFVEPSDEVPYIIVRDSLNILFTTNEGGLNADVHWSFRLECAQVTLDTNTLNQLLRTQTA
jgi:hypothetical protein